MSLLIFLSLIRSIIIIGLSILCLAFGYKFFYQRFATTKWSIQKHQAFTSKLELFQQISTTKSSEEFLGIFQIQQGQLKTIELVNLKINRTLLIQSLKYCSKLESLRLINVSFTTSPGDFEERVHLPNLRQFALRTKTTSESGSGSAEFSGAGAGGENYFYYVEDDVQTMNQFRDWYSFKTLIPFTTMGFQQVISTNNQIFGGSDVNASEHDQSKPKSYEYSIDDFNWLVVSSNTDLDVRIGNIRLFTVIHSQGLLLSFLTFNQQLLHQIQQPNQFELKHLYLLDDLSPISIDTIPNDLITLFSNKMYISEHKNRGLLSRRQIKSHFEIKIAQLRRIQELRIFLHSNVKWLDLHSICPLVRHLAISNGILTNHFDVRFLFVQNLALDAYLIDDETIVDKLPSIFPNCRKVVLDFSSINSEVHERKLLTQILKLPKVDWIVVRFYQIRRFKIWTEHAEIELFLDSLGIGEDSDCFLITRSRVVGEWGQGGDWKGVDLTFDQVRFLTGQLSAHADDFIISQVGWLT